MFKWESEELSGQQESLEVSQRHQLAILMEAAEVDSLKDFFLNHLLKNKTLKESFLEEFDRDFNFHDLSYYTAMIDQMVQASQEAYAYPDYNYKGFEDCVENEVDLVGDVADFLDEHIDSMIKAGAYDLALGIMGYVIQTYQQTDLVNASDQRYIVEGLEDLLTDLVNQSSLGQLKEIFNHILNFQNMESPANIIDELVVRIFPAYEDSLYDGPKLTYLKQRYQTIQG